MTADLERRYRRWLRWYPETFRREHEADMLGVLMAGARADQRRPALTECLALLRNALWLRLCPYVSRSDRAVVAAVKLMYLGAVVELAAAITIVATIGNVRVTVARRNPGLTADQWHAMVAGHLEPTAVAAGLAAGFWLSMAWSIGRGQRGTRLAFALFFGLNTWGLVNGLAGGGGGVRPARPGHRERPLAGRTCGRRAAGRQSHRRWGLAAMRLGRGSGRFEAANDSSWQETGLAAKCPAADARTPSRPVPPHLPWAVAVSWPRGCRGDVGCG